MRRQARGRRSAATPATPAEGGSPAEPPKSRTQTRKAAVESSRAGGPAKRAAKAPGAKARAAGRPTAPTAAGPTAERDPNEQVVLRPYMRGTLGLLLALPADRPIDEAGLARHLGGRTPGWPRFVEQLLALRLADDVAPDHRTLFLVTPAGLMLRERLIQPPGRAVPREPTFLERLGLEVLALIEAVAEQGPVRVDEVVAACHHLPGNNREPPLARSRLARLARQRRLIELVPDDAAVIPALRRYRATDAAWHVIAARRRLHPDAYDLAAFTACLDTIRGTAGRSGAGPARRAPWRGRRRKTAAPGQLSLF